MRRTQRLTQHVVASEQSAAVPLFFDPLPGMASFLKGLSRVVGVRKYEYIYIYVYDIGISIIPLCSFYCNVYVHIGMCTYGLHGSYNS